MQAKQQIHHIVSLYTDMLNQIVHLVCEVNKLVESGWIEGQFSLLECLEVKFFNMWKVFITLQMCPSCKVVHLFKALSIVLIALIFLWFIRELIPLHKSHPILGIVPNPPHELKVIYDF